MPGSKGRLNRDRVGRAACTADACRCLALTWVFYAGRVLPLGMIVVQATAGRAYYWGADFDDRSCESQHARQLAAPPPVPPSTP